VFGWSRCRILTNGFGPSRRYSVSLQYARAFGSRRWRRQVCQMQALSDSASGISLRHQAQKTRSKDLRSWTNLPSENVNCCARVKCSTRAIPMTSSTSWATCISTNRNQELHAIADRTLLEDCPPFEIDRSDTCKKQSVTLAQAAVEVCHSSQLSK
jgi:hypothetical protein